MGTRNKVIVAALLLLVVPTLGRAAVVTQYTAGTNSVANFYLGQSFTTPLDFLYGTLTFNFYAGSSASTPEAAGTAFLLTQPYTGAPADLGFGTPGLLAGSTSSANGVYMFNPGTILATGTTYYLYTNASFVTASGITTGSGYAGGNAYAATGSGNFASFTGRDFNFTLNGIAMGLPIPEPSTLIIGFVASLGGVGLAARRRRMVGL